MTRLVTLLLFLHMARGVLGADHQPPSSLMLDGGEHDVQEQQLLLP